MLQPRYDKHTATIYLKSIELLLGTTKYSVSYPAGGTHSL